MDFVTFEIAKKLKEKGFRKPCFATYDNDGMLGYVYYQPKRIHAVSFDDCLYYGDDVVVAPTISQVLKWLRDEKNIHINVEVYPNGWNFFCCSCEKHNNGKFGDYNIYETLEMHNSYELAAIAGIKYVLDNLI